MRILLKSIFGFVICPFLLHAQLSERPQYAPKKEKHQNVTDELGRKQGTWKFYNVDGSLGQDIEYLDGVKHGTIKRYYPGQKIMTETEYQYGIKEGSYKTYYYGGQLRTEGEFEGSKRISHWTNWYSNGTMQSEGEYVKGLKDGPWKYYNRKGDIINIVKFIKGKNQDMIAAEAKKLADKKAKDDKLKKQKVLITNPNTKLPKDTVKKKLPGS